MEYTSESIIIQMEEEFGNDYNTKEDEMMRKTKYILDALGDTSKIIKTAKRLQSGEKVIGYSLCPKCKGSGFAVIDSLNMCHRCYGLGFLKEE